MTIDDKNILWLDLFGFATYNKKKKLLDACPRGSDIKKSFLHNDLARSLFTEQEINRMMSVDDEKFEKILSTYQAKGIICITINDEKFPNLLKQIDTPPFCLYCKGNIQLLNSLCVGIVGTRKPTDYGIVVTKQFANALAQNDITIVSGLAVGVDTIAHKAALDVSGKTIAVLAGGLNHIYPASNYQLARTMAENNLLISENAPDIAPQSYYFPIRNRIIAALSSGVLVTEAGEKSGSLHTINYAINYGKEIFVVPGKITSPMSVGTNRLIKECSAALVLSPDDILETLNIQKENSKNQSIQLDLNEQIILDYIMAEKKTFQEIADHIGMPINQLNSTLLNMEMEGLITKLANNSYIKS